MLRSVVVAVAATVVLAGCGTSEGEEGPEPGAVTTSASAEHINYGASLAQVRAHHAIALELYRRGDLAGAETHIGHPIHELLGVISAELEEVDSGLAADLEAALQAPADLSADGGRPEALAQAFDEAARLTESAAGAYLGEEATERSFRASVVASLTATAAHEYHEFYETASSDDPATVEFQDGYAFLTEAKRLYEELEADVVASAPEEAAEIDEAFSTLEAAMPSIRVPRELGGEEDVEAAAALIGHELEETLGATVPEDRDADEVASEIRRLLADVVEKYRAGDAAEASELAAEAYLENYEVIEADVIEAAPDINEQLEPLLGAELRRRIQREVPVEELAALVEDAEALLDEALEVLEAEAE